MREEPGSSSPSSSPTPSKPPGSGVRLPRLLAGVAAAGFALGAVAGGMGSALLSGLAWAAAAALGGVAGLLAFLAFADFFLSAGPDDDVIARLAGSWLIPAFVVLGAAVACGFLVLLLDIGPPFTFYFSAREAAPVGLMTSMNGLFLGHPMTRWAKAKK